MTSKHVPLWTGTSVGPLVNTDTVDELTANAGVTVDGLLIKDLDITGADDIVSATLTSDTITANTEVQADVINELTPTLGVTVDGVLLKDNNVTGDTLTANTEVQTDQISEKTGGSGVTISDDLKATSGTASTNATTGALVVTGGIGISGSTYVGGTVNTDAISDISGGGVTVEGVLLNASNVTGNVLTANTEIQTDQISEKTGGSGVTVPDDLKATSGTASTNTTTGALVVTGGLGVGGSANFGVNLNVPVATADTVTATTSIVTNDISERTALSGVTIDGVLLKDTTITADNVTYNTEVITSLTTTLSSSRRVSIIDLTTPLGVTKALYDSSSSGTLARLPVATVNGTRKTILLQEGQTDWITVETETAIGSYPWVRYFVLKPTQRVLHLKYETDHWEQDSQSLIDEYLLSISDFTTAVTTNDLRAAIDANGTRYAFIYGTDLYHYTIENNDTTQVEIIDLTVGIFAQTINFFRIAVSMSHDGVVLLVGNLGNGTSESGEVAVFRLTAGLFVHDITFTPSVAATIFGGDVSISADGTRCAVADRPKVNIYTLSVGSAVQNASFTQTGNSTVTCAMSGDGHWMATGALTGSTINIYTDLPGGASSWTLFQSISNKTAEFSGVSLDYYGTTLVAGKRTPTTTGSLSTFFRMPGDLSTNAFSDLGTVTHTSASGYYSGTVGYFGISTDGMTLAWRNMRYWGIQRRTSLQEQFTPISEAFLPADNGRVGISPLGNLVSLYSAVSAGSYRLRILRTRKTDENLNLIDSSETNARALIKGSGHVGGDLDVIGDITAASISFDSGTNTLSTLVNETTWTTTISSLTNLVNSPSFSDNIHQRFGDEVTAHTTITGLSTSGAGTTSFVIDTLPATPSSASCHIGTLYSNNNFIIGSVTYASSTATAVWTELSGAATTILLQLNYIAA